jgi:hypothetical protein
VNMGISFEKKIPGEQAFGTFIKIPIFALL